MPIGSVWELDVNDGDSFTCLAVVIGERNMRTGNYPLLMLTCHGPWKTQPGQVFPAAVTSARYWRRFA